MTAEGRRAKTWAGGLDVAGTVAEIADVPEFAAIGRAFVTLRTGHRVTLAQLAEGTADIFQFVVDVVRDFRQPNDHRQHANRGDQHQFGRDDETVVVIPQGNSKLTGGGGEIGHVENRFRSGAGGGGGEQVADHRCLVSHTRWRE